MHGENLKLHLAVLSTARLHGESNAQAHVTLPLYLTSKGNETKT
jgi:hypothetical protein